MHHFITLTSVFLFFIFIDNNQYFDLNFKLKLLKIFFIFLIIFLIYSILPNLFLKFIEYDFRISNKTYFSTFGNKIYLDQNVNGQTRILFILEIFSFLIFRNLYQ